MIVKNLAVAAVSAALVAVSVVPAFAFGGFTGNFASVKTTVNSTSNSGGNVQGMGGNKNFGLSGNGVSVDSKIKTGSSNTQTAVFQGTNTNLGENHGVSFNGASVNTTVNSLSNTGDNGQGVGGNKNGFGSGNGVAWDSHITTGNSTTHTFVVNAVNTNVSLY
ncbi:MAG TPA: hypothetical protein VN711_02830 [Candidatus Saccharimonadales bacterium]|nr:hypothetical protein [Candidatus Saccharimonadales bacterium]